MCLSSGQEGQLTFLIKRIFLGYFGLHLRHSIEFKIYKSTDK